LCYCYGSFFIYLDEDRLTFPKFDVCISQNMSQKCFFLGFVLFYERINQSDDCIKFVSDRQRGECLAILILFYMSGTATR
jgi:hypothetical protein